MGCGEIVLVFRIIALIIAFGLAAAGSPYCCGGAGGVGGFWLAVDGAGLGYFGGVGV